MLGQIGMYHMSSQLNDSSWTRKQTFKAMNPLFPLASLSSDINHFEAESLEEEPGLHDARRLHPGSEDVLHCGYVFGSRYSVEGV